MRPVDRLLIVSGNLFDASSFDSSTGAIWQELALRMDAVAVFARNSSQSFSIERRGNVTLYLIPCGPRRMVTFLVTSWLLPWALLLFRPTIVVSQSAVYGGLASLIFSKQFMRIPTILEIHGEHYLRPGRGGAIAHRFFYRPLSAISLARATAVRSLSPSMTSTIRASFGEEVARKCVEIPNRVDLAVFSPGAEMACEPGQKLRLISVGALTATKNHVSLIRNLARAPVQTVLTVVGTGPCEGAISAAARDYGVKVRLCGQLSHEGLVDELRRADVFVHYSKTEAVPRVILEAMATGLPVVSGPAGFLDGIVTDGETGVLMPDWSVESLTAALHRVQSPSARLEMGRQGLRRARMKHDATRVFDEWAAFLKKLSANPSALEAGPP